MSSKSIVATLESVFSHVVLPPKVPHEQDKNPEEVGNAIAALLVQAVTTMTKLVGQNQASTWRALRRTLRFCQLLHVSGRLERRSLLQEFQDFKQDQPLILFIGEQNAALLVRRDVR